MPIANPAQPANPRGCVRDICAELKRGDISSYVVAFDAPQGAVLHNAYLASGDGIPCSAGAALTRVTAADVRFHHGPVPIAGIPEATLEFADAAVAPATLDLDIRGTGRFACVRIPLRGGTGGPGLGS